MIHIPTEKLVDFEKHIRRAGAGKGAGQPRPGQRRAEQDWPTISRPPAHFCSAR